MFSSSGDRWPLRAGDSIPGLADLACNPAAPASAASKPLLLALRGVALTRGAEGGPPSTDLAPTAGCRDGSPPGRLLRLLLALRMLLLGCRALEVLQVQASKQADHSML